MVRKSTISLLYHLHSVLKYLKPQVLVINSEFKTKIESLLPISERVLLQKVIFILL